jgi:hypothetical protein
MHASTTVPLSLAPRLHLLCPCCVLCWRLCGIEGRGEGGYEEVSTVFVCGNRPAIISRGNETSVRGMIEKGERGQSQMSVFMLRNENEKMSGDPLGLDRLQTTLHRRGNGRGFERGGWGVVERIASERSKGIWREKEVQMTS